MKIDKKWDLFEQCKGWQTNLKYGNIVRKRETLKSYKFQDFFSFSWRMLLYISEFIMIQFSGHNLDNTVANTFGADDNSSINRNEYNGNMKSFI